MGGDVDQSALGTFLTDLFVPGVYVVEKILRTIIIYLFLVVILRVGGRRELAQMNAFDLVVLMTLSNAVQNAIIGDDNSLIGGIIGGTTLVLVNLAVVRYLYHHPGLDRRIEGQPLLLVKNGRVLRHHLKRELITEAELRSAVHRQGVDHIEECSEVILETSGVITVIANQPSSSDLVRTEIVDRLERVERLLTERSSPTQSPATGD
jgi:uncharacterized membrane protein YcaP (DUF421 family)